MYDLISRKALLEAAEHNVEFQEGIVDVYILESILAGMSAVDAAPVVHGRWIKKKNPQWPAYSHDCCSVCGWWNTKNALSYDGNRKPGHSLNYCPNCGAKMDGGNDND